MKNLKKRPPFDFVLEELADIITDIKPMFGAFGIYRQNQILMILRKKEEHPYDNGMWLAIPNEHWTSLKQEIKELRDIVMFGPGPTGWQVLAEDLPNFEELCLSICELIRKRDPRIGKTPKSKLRKTPKKKVKPKMIKKVVKKKKKQTAKRK
jgi:hypothetical protein